MLTRKHFAFLCSDVLYSKERCESMEDTVHRVEGHSDKSVPMTPNSDKYHMNDMIFISYLNHFVVFDDLILIFIIAQHWYRFKSSSSLHKILPRLTTPYSRYSNVIFWKQF